MHAAADEEEGEAGVDVAVVEGVCDVSESMRWSARVDSPRSSGFESTRICSYILIRSSDGRSKKRKGCLGAGEGSLDCHREGAAEETTLVAALVVIEDVFLCFAIAN